MKHINLDDFACAHLQNLSEQAKLYGWHKATTYDMHPKQLINWRKREEFYNLAYTKLMTRNQALLDWMKTLREKANVNALLFLSKEDPEFADVYSDEGTLTSRNTVQDLIKRCTKDVNWKIAAIDGEQAEYYYREEEYINSIRRRVTFLYTAFVRAVEARLRVYATQHLHHKSSKYYYRYRPAFFTIFNQGRHHLIQIDQNGQFNWLSNMLEPELIISE